MCTPTTASRSFLRQQTRRQRTAPPNRQAAAVLAARSAAAPGGRGGMRLRQYFARDTDLAHWIEPKAAIAPAQNTVAGWAAELAAAVVVDIATNLLPASVLAQTARRERPGLCVYRRRSRARAGAYADAERRLCRRGRCYPAGALIIAALGLKPVAGSARRKRRCAITWNAATLPT